MPSVSCFFKNPLSWMTFLGLVLAGFLGCGFSSILFTSSVLTLSSTVIFKFLKQKPRSELVEESVLEDEIVAPVQQNSPCIAEDESIAEKKKEGQEEEEYMGKIDDEYLGRSSPVTLSESDHCCLGRSSTSDQDSEADDWPFQDTLDCSDGSISDEDSLIEIALPSGHYIGHDYKEGQEPNSKFNLQKKLPDFVAAAATESFFKQHGLMELLAELNDMNEEENLIEIDISMGSIKCPRFEIEA